MEIQKQRLPPYTHHSSMGSHINSDAATHRLVLWCFQCLKHLHRQLLPPGINDTHNRCPTVEETFSILAFLSITQLKVTRQKTMPYNVMQSWLGSVHLLSMNFLGTAKAILARCSSTAHMGLSGNQIRLSQEKSPLPEHQNNGCS